MTKAAEERARKAAVAAVILLAKGEAALLPRCSYRCRACGEESKTWAAADRHSLETAHTRIEIVL